MSVFWCLRQGRKWNIGFSEGGTEIRDGGMTFTFLIWPRMETTKKGFEPFPFVLDYVKKGRIVKRWYTASKSALSFVKILSSGILIQEQHIKVRMLLLLARISCELGLITPSRILTRKVYCSKQELAQGHDRGLSFHLRLMLSLKTKSMVTLISLLLLVFRVPLIGGLPPTLPDFIHKCRKPEGE